LKIDGQFIRDIVDDPLDDAAVRCFIDASRIVGALTVAEFVENEAIVKRLKELGVDYLQGYLIHRPEPFQRVLNSLNQAAK
jgi:EAL domain-containing protein (putative c-di-GMP-specific phosphodiesterase class I)